jgi:hypothetical protein
MRRQLQVGVGVWAVFAVMACAGVALGQDTFGTDRITAYTIPEWEFGPVDSTQTYSDTSIAAGIGMGTFNVRRYSTGGDSGFFAGPHLPEGALLTNITYNLCDSSQADLHWTASLWMCTTVDGTCAQIGNEVESTSSEISPCFPYTQDISSLNVVVDNYTWELMVVANPDADDATNSLASVVIGYKLQVSPAPPFATFADVPTDHPFFQFVEALAASGITAGCGSGNFCPDAPLTRGQMAVFLSKGLGLQWPVP